MARAADRTAAAMRQAEPRSVLTKLMAVFEKPNFPQKYSNKLSNTSGSLMPNTHKRANESLYCPLCDRN